MKTAWEIKVHPLVKTQDLKKLSPDQWAKIKKQIKKKLAQDPQGYGVRLKGAFKDFYKLRVGDYRVIYQIVSDKILVLVVKVGIRRDYQVYEEFFHRIDKLK